jgi:hypothetical protein
MPSNYEAFDVKIFNDEGTETLLAGVTLKVYDATNLADLPDVTADGSGQVAAGTLNVAAGTVVRFRLENSMGRAGYWEHVTT